MLMWLIIASGIEQRAGETTRQVQPISLSAVVPHIHSSMVAYSTLPSLYSFLDEAYFLEGGQPVLSLTCRVKRV